MNNILDHNDITFFSIGGFPHTHPQNPADVSEKEIRKNLIGLENLIEISSAS